MERSLQQLAMQKKEQSQVLKKLQHQHYLCLMEIIRNINDLEELSGKQIDDEVIANISKSCPIDLFLSEDDSCANSSQLQSVNVGELAQRNQAILTFKDKLKSE